jgi:hypothetical protein
MNLEPGDLLFYPDDGKWKHAIFAKAQEWAGEMGEVKSPGMTHVALVAFPSDLGVDMKWPKPAFRFMADDSRPKRIMRPGCDERTKLRAIYWCYMNIGEHYSFVDMLLGKMGLVRCYKVCSAWVDRAYKEAGFPLTSESDKLVSPNELFSSKRLTEVTDYAA